MEWVAWAPSEIIASRGAFYKRVFQEDGDHLMCISRVFKLCFGIYLYVPAFTPLIVLEAWGWVFGFGQTGHLCCTNWFLLGRMNGEHRAPGLRIKTKQTSVLFGDVNALAVWMGEVWQGPLLGLHYHVGWYPIGWYVFPQIAIKWLLYMTVCIH